MARGKKQDARENHLKESSRDDGWNVEVFENDIALYLRLFCEENGFSSPADLTQNNWNGAMMYIHKYVFPTKDILKLHKHLDGYLSNNYNNQFSNLNNSNCNAYDINKVNSICDYYIYLCAIYDKEINIYSFSLLTGITLETLYSWGSKERILSNSGYEIFQKLYKGRVESLGAKLATNKGNPVGILAILNHYYGWNLPGVSKEQASKPALTAADLPKLMNNNKQIVDKNTETQDIVDEDS